VLNRNALDAEAVAQAADDERAAAEAAQAQAEAQAASAAQVPAADTDETPLPDDDVPSRGRGAPETAEVEVPASDEGEDEGPTQLVPPPVEPPTAHLPQVWVLELSSFQLDGTAGGDWDSVPTAATVLNLTRTTWTGTAAWPPMRRQAGGVRPQALMVLNRDDPLVMGMVPQPGDRQGWATATASRARASAASAWTRRTRRATSA
jgi:UDP-N-acetylmuramoylalanine--D-glutamate ligase